MMKSFTWRLAAAFFLAAFASAFGQTTAAPQGLALQGLLASAGHGGLPASAWLPDGTLVLLEDMGDGVRLIKTDAGVTTVLAQARIGSAGDSGLALAVDASGNIYVTGTSSGSGSISGTAGTAFPTRTDTSTNGFVAKLNASLQPRFVSFLGAGKTAPTAIAATGDAVFVTGSTYSTSFPVTASAIGQSPAAGSSGNGFVERFDNITGALRYATLLTGYGGDTAPAALIANSADNAYVVGLTFASGFPTLNAIEPQIIGSTSGFLTELTPSADGYVFSTFIAGAGLTSAAFDTQGALLLSGNVSMSGFPISSVSAPVAATNYQTLLRMPSSGQSVTSSTLLVPGSTSRVAASADGGAWISGSGGAVPLFPASALPKLAEGDGFLLHVSAENVIDRSVRLGGSPMSNAAYASLTTTPATPSVTPDGQTVVEASTLTATAAATLVATQRFDLPLANAPNGVLTATTHDLLLTCSSGQCTGKGGLLTVLNASASATLALSSDGLPDLRAYDLGPTDAQGLSITASGFAQSNSCGSELASGAACALSLSGSGPGSVTLSAANGNTATISLPANTAPASVVATSATELDFGVVTSAAPVSRTLALTNFTSMAQTVAIKGDGASSSAYTVSFRSSDCASADSSGIRVAANSACHATFTLTASNLAANDSIVHAAWLVGNKDLLLTGSTEAASLSVSSTELDFGVQFQGQISLSLPRDVFLSNNGPIAMAHARVILPPSSPFQAIDSCPEAMPAHTACRIQFTYQSSSAPAKDTLTVALDDGLNVLLSGETLPQPTATGTTTNPNLVVTPSNITFSTAVPVTGVASPTQSVTVRNTGASGIAIAVASSGDFTSSNQCPTTLGGGASCTVFVGFTPSAPGVRQGILSVTGGSGFAPTYVSLGGTASAILPPNNGVLDLGQTYVGEPLFAWYKVQQSFPSITAVAAGSGFSVVIVEESGSGHGTPPLSSYTQSATSTCNNCWVGIAYTPAANGTATGTLSLSTAASGKAYTLELEASALAVAGVLIDPPMADFGTTSVHTTAALQRIALTNLLPSATTLNIANVQASGDFRLAANNSGGPSCNGPVAPTATCFVDVLFAPSATGQRTGSLTFTTDHGTFVGMLTGFGTEDPGVAISPSSLIFANTNDVSAISQTLAITNTGTATITVGSVTSSSSAFTVSQSGSTLSPGDVLSVQVHFTPAQQFASATLNIPITQLVNGQSLLTNYSVPVSSTYAASASGLVILPGEANFGATATDTAGYTREFTLANFGGHALNISFAMPRQFSLAAEPSACAQLSSGGTCVFSATFAPSTTGEATGTVAVTGVPTDGSATVQALGYVIGYGAGNATLSFTAPGIIPNTPLSFGLVNSGQSQSNTITLKNSGSGPLTIHRISVSPPFFATTTCGATMAAGTTCSVAVTYAPVDETSTTNAVPRLDLATLTVESNALSSPNLIALSGSVQPVITGTNNNGSTLNSFSLSTSALTFTNVAVGNQSAPQTVVLTNTGNTTLHANGVLGTTDFAAITNCSTVSPGATCTISVTFAPSITSTAPMRSGAIEIQSDAATALEFVSVVGPSSPSPLLLSSTALDFGTVSVGATSQLGLTLTNTTPAPITMLAVSTTGDFRAARGTCPANGATLAAGSSCLLYVTFSPTTTGARTGTLNITTDATQNPLAIALTGTGAAGKLTASPASLSFGPIAVGASSTIALTLSNSGTAPITSLQASITGVDASDFAVTVPCVATQLASGASCSMTVRFTPAALGSAAALLSIASNDPASPLLVPMNGSGVQGGGFTLTVDGGSVASRSISSGSPAAYGLLVTPTAGFSGTVALTCTPIVAAQYGTCSLLPSVLALNTSAAQSSTATINTVTSVSIRGGLVVATLLLLPFARRSRYRRLHIALVGICSLGALEGCGGSSTPGNLRYTPAGTYQYRVTASSTSGPAASASVTLNLTVQ